MPGVGKMAQWMKCFSYVHMNEGSDSQHYRDAEWKWQPAYDSKAWKAETEALRSKLAKLD